MPCYDHRTSYEHVTEHTVEPLRKELAKVEAYLCAVMKVLEKNRLVIPTMTQIDTEEAGIHPDDIYGWWLLHRAKDAKRKEQSDD